MRKVQALISRIENELGRLDILVNDVWRAEYLAHWNVPVMVFVILTAHSLTAGGIS
ncbi:hypothetical protein [Paenibacillus sp. FSL H7-0331]|uniref:hypothetical protein n=1 Tax=Paenibacillus sp. FSL H7-0331 TaxID=1920421 RepID=UPI0015C33390|nr:hypothetical protein [Paenibacillus sp. FSL H7-0331]